MTRDQAIGLIGLTGALIVVGRGLAARRLPSARIARLALLWVAVFAVATIAVTVLDIRWEG